jgi:hypothetical protein
MTVDMSQSQSGKLDEELYMKGIWEGICECTEIHPSDALRKVKVKRRVFKVFKHGEMTFGMIS